MVTTLGNVNAQSTSSKEEDKGQYECFKFQYKNKDSVLLLIFTIIYISIKLHRPLHRRHKTHIKPAVHVLVKRIFQAHAIIVKRNHI